MSPHDYINSVLGGRVIDATLPRNAYNYEWRYQCVSLIKDYLRRCFNMNPGAWGDAVDYWTNTHPNILQRFDRLPASTPMKLGDIVILDGITIYEHIAIGLNTEQVVEQNGGGGTGTGTGTDAIRVRTIKMKEKIGILRPKGEGLMIVTDAPNWHGRLNKTMVQIRGRGMSYEEMKPFFGKDFLTFVEAVSDDVEADRASQWREVGRVATNDNWAGQIYSLQDQVKALGDRPTLETLATLNKQIETLSASAKSCEAENESLKTTQESDKKAGDDFIRRIGQFISKYLPGSK